MSTTLETRPSAKNKSLAPLRGLLPYLLPYKAIIALALLFLVLAAAMTLAMPVAFRRVLDFGIMAKDSTVISQYFLMLLLLSVLLAAFASLRFFLVSWIGERVVADLRAALFKHVLGLTPSFFEDSRTGEILSRLTTDTTLIQNVVGSSVSIALRSAVTLAGGLIMLLATSIKLAGILLLLLPVVVLPIFLIGRRIRKLSRLSQDKIADTSGVAGEIINALQIVQAFSLEQLKQQKFEDTVENAFNTAKRRIKTRALLTAIAMLSVMSSIVIVLWVGTVDVLTAQMTGGELAQFLLYAIIVGSSTTMIGEIWGSLQQAAGAAERIAELLATEPTVLAPPNPLPLPAKLNGEVNFQSVSFAYPTRMDTNALDDFSLHIAPRERIALVGPSGAGKSTVFQLLLNFYQPQSGRILIDGIDLKSVDPRIARRHFAVVPQSTMLFADSVLENIRYGDPDASDEQIFAAAQQASAHEFIIKLPEGYETLLGERGARLSGGQQQRIAIARAILRAPSILLLDEATSALDSESEIAVQAGLRLLATQCTTIIIAHRLSTVMEADRIVVMENGRIAAQGTHNELIAKAGIYARLAELQINNLSGSDAAQPISA